MGRASFKYAWVTDKLRTERERGQTVDVGRAKLIGSKKIFSIIDAPGHQNFVKNMLTGTSQADAVVLVVDASTGGYEGGMAECGLTRTHALYAQSLGVSQIIVAINRMDDCSVRFSQARYSDIMEEVSDYLGKVGFHKRHVSFVPISGWTGDNLIENTGKMPWYQGPSLLNIMDELDNPRRQVDKPLRIPVSDVYKIAGVGTVAVGCVEFGVMRPGMGLTLAPTGSTHEAMSIEMHHQSKSEAIPGEIVGVNLKGLEPKDIKRGHVISDSS